VTKAIRQARSLSEAEKEQIFGWGEDIFGAADLNLHWRPKDLHFMLELDGTLVSHVGVLRHEVTVGAEQVTVAGVGGVVTLPAWQRRGYARELLEHTVDFFNYWEVDAGLLFCLQRRVPFYESQGWRVVNYPVMIQQPEEIASPLEVMVLPLSEFKWPDGPVKLDSFPW
jgi:aminoglycoside 2'-N-acetyltransferase I